jgi:host factor-I protein
MNKNQMNLQDNFLNQVRKDNIQVTIYLVSGVQLKGFVRGFDSFTVILETPGKPSQLVYKHAMASVVPSRFVSAPIAREDRERAPERAEARPPESQPAEAEPAEPQPAETQTQE